MPLRQGKALLEGEQTLPEVTVHMQKNMVGSLHSRGGRSTNVYVPGKGYSSN